MVPYVLPPVVVSQGGTVLHMLVARCSTYSSHRTHLSTPQVKNSKRPYSGYKRLIEDQRKHAGTRHLSVMNSGVYQAQYERDQIDYQKGKKKWLGKKSMDTSMTDTRLKTAHAGRKMGGWTDVPPFVQVHAGPWDQNASTAATYKFREEPKMDELPAPFYTTVHREDKLYKPMYDQWEEQDAEEAALYDEQFEEDEWGEVIATSNASQVVPGIPWVT